MLRFERSSVEELADHVDFCLENIHHPRATLEITGRFFEEAADCLRARAILHLLLDADPRSFAEDLTRSGQARRGFLSRCAERGYQDYHLALSRSPSLLDTIAADNFALAGELLQGSPTDWRDGEEYEEDFCYHRFLGLLASSAPPPLLSKHLDRFAGVQQDDETRLAVCRALLDADSAQFALAFEDLLSLREAEVHEDRGLAEEDLGVALGSRVFIEGLAVLKLARRRGLPVEDAYRMCPLLALEALDPGQPVDEFQ